MSDTSDTHMAKARAIASNIPSRVKDENRKFAALVIARALAASEAKGRQDGVREGMKRPYSISEPAGGWRQLSSFTDKERARLWPIAETLAMLDGNAFFTMGTSYDEEWAAQYLPEADALYQANGGDNGWAGTARLANISEANQ